MKPKKVKFVLFIGLAASPFIFWPWAKIPYEIPRVWFISRWLELLGLAALINLLAKNPAAINSKIDGKLLGLVIAFFLWAVVASILGADLLKSIWGNYYRGDGLFTLAHLIGLFLFTALFWRSSWQKFTFQIIATGSLAAGILAIFGRTAFGQPNFLAGYLTVTLPFVWEMLRNRWSKIAVIFPIAAIAITKSWGGLLGIIIFFTYLAVKKMSRQIQLAIVSALGIMMIFAAVYFWQAAWSRPYPSRQFVPESRERIIRSVLNGALRRPLFGWGWANVDYAFDANPWPMKFQPDIYLDKAHGVILEVFTTTGVIGLAIYLLLIGRAVWLARRTAVFLPLILYLFYSQTNITSIATEVIFWLTLGIAASHQRWHDI
ncbi:O-antigen ligase family protein [Candidatus Collierbacteria bacterium]|nr:O-antigen ligase family protein [Candidatus Collierbacteria bacterium]